MPADANQMTGTTRTSTDTAVSRGPGRPRGGQLLTDRPRILEAAERAIARYGSDTTLDEIAAEASVTKPILYRTVGDRDALVLALSELFVDRINGAVTAALADVVSPRDAFETSVSAYMHTVAVHRNLFEFVNASGHRADQARRLIDRAAATVIDQFRATRPAVNQDERTATTWGYAVVGALQIVALMWLGNEYGPLDNIAKDLTNLMWQGMAT